MQNYLMIVQGYQKQLHNLFAMGTMDPLQFSVSIYNMFSQQKDRSIRNKSRRGPDPKQINEFQNYGCEIFKWQNIAQEMKSSQHNHKYASQPANSM